MIEPPLPISGSAFWTVKIVPFTLVSKVSSGLSCAVITALGDKFDFLAYYSDFRIDNQEAGTPSDGPKAGNVLGTGEGQHVLEAAGYGKYLNNRVGHSIGTRGSRQRREYGQLRISRRAGTASEHVLLN